MRTRSDTGPSLGRLIGSILVVLGIALMHHVIVSTCTSPGAPTDHAHAVSVLASETNAPTPGAGDVPAPDPSSAVACLAIMLVGWFLAPVAREWRRRRNTDTAEPTCRARVSGAPPHPPDLTVLSVRRT